MSFPTVFANLAAGNQPASLLDVMFGIVGAQGAIPCTATGTNAITVTPITNYYLPAAYTNYQIVSFAAPATTSGAVTMRLGALAFLKVYMPSGLQAGSGDLTSAAYVIAAFVSTLDSGNGGWQVFNATTPSVIQPVGGTFKNLVITNGGTPDSQVAVTADEVMLENVSGGTAKVSTVSLTISTGTSGANGLDSGSIASATFYSVWVIYNGSVTAGLISTSATTPTLPSGYTYKTRVGWVRTGAASTNLHRITQKGRRAQYVVTAGSQTVTLPLMGSGTAGTAPATYATIAVGTFVPSTASEIFISVLAAYNGGGTSNVNVAPNTAYAAASGTNPPPIVAANNTTVMLASMLLESTNIAWISTAAGGAIQCLGWNDNL